MKALVTGGGGFLGGAIARMLVARGDQVRSLARGEYPELALLGVDCRRGDLADPEAARRAAEGVDTVFHVAAKPGVWGPYEEYHRANVVGTESVLAACKACGVGRLVYTSTPSVAHAGRDLEGADESLPYATHFATHYPATKAIAERAVLAANGPELATTALRPHLIWGPGDNHLVPRLIARSRKLRRFGPAHTKIDATYIDNAASAHLAAADRLAPGAAPAGKAYFIANGEPIHVWDLLDKILAAAGLPPIRGRIPLPFALAAGAAAEGVWRLFGRAGEPPLTRFVVKQLATSHWFDLSAARRDLGYEPKVTTEEGLRRLAEHLKRNQSPHA